MKSIMKIFQDTLSGDMQSVCLPVEMNYKPTRLQTPQMKVGDTTARKGPKTPKSPAGETFKSNALLKTQGSVRQSR